MHVLILIPSKISFFYIRSTSFDSDLFIWVDPEKGRISYVLQFTLSAVLTGACEIEWTQLFARIEDVPLG